MTEIIILANSYKKGERCIAGIDTATGKWIRPVSGRPDKLITGEMRKVEGREPELLDILRIPLSHEELGDEFQPENRLIGEGEWVRVGKARPSELRNYLEQEGPLLYSRNSEGIPAKKIKGILRTYRKSLMLIECFDLESFEGSNIKGAPRAKASFSFDGSKYNLTITDCYASKTVLSGERLPRRNLLTISLGRPFQNKCYKLVAGVIPVEN